MYVHSQTNRIWTRRHKLSRAPSTSQPLSLQELLQYLNVTQFYLQAFKMYDIYFMGTECMKSGEGRRLGVCVCAGAGGGGGG